MLCDFLGRDQPERFEVYDMDMGLAPDLAAQLDQPQDHQSPAPDDAMQDQGAPNDAGQPQLQGNSPPLPLTPSITPFEPDAGGDQVSVTA